jgi:hypothetical protein
MPISRASLVASIVSAAERDPRVLGVLDYGSASENRADEWSDVDLAIFLRDSDAAEFAAEWRGWAGQFGRLLLAYTGGVGKPWAVYDAAPLPLRADFNFWPIGSAAQIGEWPNAPASIEHMLLYDASGGLLRGLVAQIVGQSLAPTSPAQAFEQVGGDFWYYALRTWARLLRRQLWAARHEYDFILLGNLMALLRIEAGATAHWRGASAAVGIERAISAERLAQLDRCVAGPGEPELRRAFSSAAGLARLVCQSIAQQHGWPWPAELADRVVAIFATVVAIFATDE